jgi:ribosomal protein L29
MKSAQLREQTEEVDHPLKIRALRRDLARIKTIMKERGIRENV